MNKIKKLNKSQIDSMSISQRKEYYKNAVEHYGNLIDSANHKYLLIII